MKRQRGRNRGGNSGGSGGGGGKPQQNVNRAFESNGPDNVKIRGNAQHVFEKYQQLARDATAAGDRVLGENYLQHAEHYFRVVRAVSPNKPASEILGRDAVASGFDIDFEDESGAQAGEDNASEAGEAETQGEGGEQRAERQDRDWQPRRDDRNYNQDRPREDRGYSQDRPREDRNYNQDRPRDERSANPDRQRDERPRDDRPRDERPRDDRPRDDRPRDDRPRDRFRDRDRNRDRDRPRDPMAVVEPESTPLTAPTPQSAPQSSPMSDLDDGPRLRSQDGSESHAPAFLQARPERAVETADEGEVRKPRRRRAPRSFEGAEGETPAKPEKEKA